jgi:hypothetical protein
MNKILLYNAAGFIIGAVVFAKVFSHRTKWERGIFLTFLVNIPNLIFLLFVIGPNYGSGRDLYSMLVVVGLVVLVGVGGFGLGAIVGMIFVFVRTHGVRGP